MQSPDPRQLDVDKTKSEIDHIYRRLSMFTQAQLELRKQTISDEELAEFELTLQNWVVDYLWPVPKTIAVDERVFLPLYPSSEALNITKERWLWNLEGSRVTVQYEDRMLTAGREYQLFFSDDELRIKFTGLPYVTPTDEYLVRACWSKNRYTVERIGQPQGQDLVIPRLIFAK